MRIVVNNIAASSGGALSILRDFHNYIVQNDKENEWIFLLGGRYLEESENIKVIVLEDVKKNWINKLRFDFISGKHFINKLKPDVVFSMQNIITFGLKMNQIVYVHQSIPFQEQNKFSFFKASERVLAVYQYLIGWIIKRSIKKADRVIVQTKWMKEAIANKTKTSAEKIFNILPNVPDFKEFKKFDVLKNNSFFYPSGEETYKNLQCIYDACDLLLKRGINDFQVELTLSESKKYKTNPNIRLLGRISREQVLEKYNTSILIFPSYIETVGLPLIEGRQLGTIILASDCPFSREVLEGYENVFYFNPFKPQELADLMERVIRCQISKKVTNEFAQSKSNSWAWVKDIILDKF